MSQQVRYPATAAATVDLAANGVNGDAAPADSLQVGGQDPSGDLVPMMFNADGELLVSVDDLPLPTGAATAANQLLEIGELQDIEADVEAMSAKLPATLGQKAMAASLSVVVSSDQSTIPVSAASLPLPTGAATEATLSSLNGKVTACDTGAVVVSSSALPTGAATEATLSTLNGKVTACDTGAVVVSSSALPSGAATEATLAANGVLIGAVNEAAPGTDTASSGLNGRLQRIAQRLTSMIAQLPATLGQKTMANSLAVTMASDQSAVPTNEAGAGTGTTSNVASSASNVTILASNANRKGATVTNDSTAVLYLKFGATASTSSYTVQVPSMGYYEVPFKYTGIIDGIWSSANGNARVTELT